MPTFQEFQIYQEFQVGTGPSWAKQTVRLFSGAEDSFDILFEVGALPSKTEVVVGFKSNINSLGSFVTDSNGYEEQRRQYVYDLTLEGNFYPIVYYTYIRDEVSQLSLITERAHGGTSQSNGQLEVMIARNPDMGDGFGPGLTDLDVVYPAVRVLVGSPSHTNVYKHSYKFNFPLAVYSTPTSSISDFEMNYNPSLKFLTRDLPQNVHLLSFNSLTPNTVILRLAHVFGIGQDATLSQPVELDFGDLFAGLKIASIVETTLTANKILVNSSPSKITIGPKDIRTFVLTF